MKAIILSSLVFLLSCGEVYNSDEYSQSTLSHMSNPSIVNYSRWRTLPAYQLSEPNFQLAVGDMYTVCNGEGTTYRISRNGKKLSKITCDANNNMTVEHEVITDGDKCENWYRTTQLTEDHVLFNSATEERLDDCAEGQLYGRRTIIWVVGSNGIPMKIGKLIEGSLVNDDGLRMFRQCVYNNENLCNWVDYSPYVNCYDGGWIYLNDVVIANQIIGTTKCVVDYTVVAESCDTLGVRDSCGSVRLDYGEDENEFICNDISGNMYLFSDYLLSDLWAICGVFTLTSVNISPSCNSDGHVQYILPVHFTDIRGAECELLSEPPVIATQGITFKASKDSTSDLYVYGAEE